MLRAAHHKTGGRNSIPGHNNTMDLSGLEVDIVASRWVAKITAMIPLPKSFRESLHCQLSEGRRRRFVEK